MHKNKENVKNMNCGSAFEEKSACKEIILKNSQLWSALNEKMCIRK